MDLHLKDKVAIVTGGTKGIGVGIVLSFANEDAITVIVNRPGSEGPNLEKQLKDQGKKTLYIPAELTKDEECQKVINETVKHFGRLDYIINNAGFNDGVGIDRSPEEFMQSVHNNLFHYYALVHYGLKYLIQSKGSVVNIGSHVSITGQGSTSGYAAAKGAINALTREWAVALAKYSIRVNTVIPGSVWTNSYERWANTFPDPEERKQLAASRIPFEKRFTTVEEIADIVVFLASDRSSHTTGQIIIPDGGYTHLDRAYT